MCSGLCETQVVATLQACCEFQTVGKCWVVATMGRFSIIFFKVTLAKWNVAEFDTCALEGVKLFSLITNETFLSWWEYLFQHDNVPSTGHKYFDEDENYINDINNKLWPSQSPPPTPSSSSSSLLSSSKTPVGGMSFGRMVFIPPVQFQRCSISMPGHSEALLVVCGGPIP